jgi:peptidyl-dipeptidase A
MYEQRIVPIRIKYNLAAFLAATNGRDADIAAAAQAKEQLASVLSNSSVFARIVAYKSKQASLSPETQRKLQLLYLEYLPYQGDPKVTDAVFRAEILLRQEFASYRTTVNSHSYSKHELQRLFTASDSSQILKEAWYNAKSNGTNLAQRIIALVKLRNKLAQGIGFSNYYELQFAINEQTNKQVDSLFNEYVIITQGPYNQVKAEIDQKLAQKFKIHKAELQAWHYGGEFFQLAPKIWSTPSDTPFDSAHTVNLIAGYFKSIQLPVDTLLQNSDLYNRDHKSQLGEARDIDYTDDVRVIFTLNQTAFSARALVYEMVWALYLRNAPSELSLYHRPAHFFVADGLATLIANDFLSPDNNPQFASVSAYEQYSAQRMYRKQLNLQRYVFGRWALLMYRFETALYQNPDQDLDLLWRQLHLQIQGIRLPADTPKGAWASKEHFLSMPCIYHNFLLGQLWEAQLQNYLGSSRGVSHKTNCSQQLPAYPELGTFFNTMIFRQGAKSTWPDLVRSVTGEDLKADYFYMLSVTD